MVDPVTIGYGVSALIGLWGASESSSAARRAEEIGRLNAATLLETTEANIERQLMAAEYNAGSILRIGEANARAIEDVYNRNSVLMAAEGLEGVRRHFIQEAHHLGTLRAMQAGNGISVNEGNPLHQFLDQAYEAEYSRKWQGARAKTSVLNYMFEQQTRADLTRMDASERATTLIFNANIESEIAMAEAGAQALALERGGSLAGSNLRAQAMGQLFSAIGSGAQFYESL